MTKQDIRAVWRALVLGLASIGVSLVSDYTTPVSVQVAASVVATGLFLAGVFVFFGIPKRYPCFAEGGWKGFHRLICWGLTSDFIVFLCGDIARKLGNHGIWMVFGGSGAVLGFCLAVAVLLVLVVRRNALRRGSFPRR